MLHRDRLATSEDLPHLAQAVQLAGHHLIEQRRGQPQRIDPRPADDAAQVGQRLQPGRRDNQPAPVEQGAPQLQGGGIEADRRVLKKHQVGAQCHEPGVLDQPHHAAVLDAGTLGPAGGAGGVHQVGQAAPSGECLHQCGGSFHLRPVAVQRQHPAGVGRQSLAQRGLREQHRCRRVGQHELEPHRGVGRVQRQVGAAGLQDAEQPDHHLEAALDHQGNRRLVADTQRLQVRSQARAARVELGIIHRAALLLQRHGAGRGCRLCREQLADAALARVGGGGAVPVDQHALPLGRGQHADLAQPRLRPCGHRHQHGVHMAEQTFHRRTFEALGVVHQRDVQCRVEGDEDCQRLIAGLIHLAPGDRQAGGRGGRRIEPVLEGQHRVEQRLAGADVAPALHGGQTTVAVLAHRRQG